MLQDNNFAKFNPNGNNVRHSTEDTKGKLEELMNDEELKEAFRKLSNKPEDKKDYVAPGATGKEKNEIKASEDGYTIEHLIDKECADKYPEELRRLDLELIYIGLLIDNPAAISMYYFVAPICLFADPRMINIYKGILFTEGEAYAPAIAKEKSSSPVVV